MTLRELSYQLSFNTPAFFGNAEQQAQWRTPLFKALLKRVDAQVFASLNT